MSNGWQKEQDVFTSGKYIRLVGNIYIGKLTRNTDNIVVSGSVRLGCRGSEMWYANRIAISVDNGSQKVQIKGWTSGAILTGTNFDVPFTATIPCASTATSATIKVHYDDQQNSGSGWIHKTLSWTLNFNQAVRKPALSCGNLWSKSPGVWRLQSGLSRIDWGIGYTTRTLTATVTYTFRGTSYSYTAGSWTDGRTSASIDINAYDSAEPWLKVPAGANATIKWTVSTNLGSVSCSTSTYCKAPNTPTIATVTTANPAVYKLTSSVSGINWGDYHKSTSLQAKVTGNIDGTPFSWTTTPITTGATSGSFSYDALALNPSAPWLKVPDDETVTVTWSAVINVGYTTLASVISRSQYCCKSYTAYVIDSNVNGGKPVEADLIISNNPGSVPNKVLRRVTTI